jgi:hypothetical protein
MWRETRSPSGHGLVQPLDELSALLGLDLHPRRLRSVATFAASDRVGMLELPQELGVWLTIGVEVRPTCG